MRRTMPLALLLAVAALVGCGGDDGQVFTDEDSTAEALVDAGESFEVRLESNPSTGYAWEVSPMTEVGLAELVDHRYEEPDTDLVGAAGEEIFEFRAGTEGAGILRLEYVRAFEDEPVAERVFELIIRIDGADWPPAGGTPPPAATATAPVTVGVLVSSGEPGDVVVRGVVVWSGDVARLCDALAESFPPQCGGASLEIANPQDLDVDLEEAQGVRWTDPPVELAASFDGQRLVVGQR